MKLTKPGSMNRFPRRPPQKRNALEVFLNRNPVLVPIGIASSSFLVGFQVRGFFGDLQIAQLKQEAKLRADQLRLPAGMDIKEAKLGEGDATNLIDIVFHAEFHAEFRVKKDLAAKWRN